jgi:hypothetical protein
VQADMPTPCRSLGLRLSHVSPQSLHHEERPNCRERLIH